MTPTQLSSFPARALKSPAADVRERKREREEKI